jgi:uncharacterized protein YjbI with pentapeptide repeats
MNRFTPLFAVGPLILATPTQADIYQWEYIDPADPSQGKQQSTALAPDGAGVDAVPGAYLAGRNLTMAYLIAADLTGADLNLADLTNAVFDRATLTDADFTGAEVREASFAAGFCISGFGCPRPGTGITLAQLYSTANYQIHDLSGISLFMNNLASGNFAGQNLSNANLGRATLAGADFREANLSNAAFFLATLTGADFNHANLSKVSFNDTGLTDADFTGAEVRGASFTRFGNLTEGITLAQLYSTASYQAHDLSGISLSLNSLSGANFADQNLTDANFLGARLTAADFSGAEIRGADLSIFNPIQFPFGTGITLAQLYSTASYQSRDLSGINFANNNLFDGNFAGQNLTNAYFNNTTLIGADFTAGDVRGGYLGPNLADVIATNLIRPDGHIDGLDLNGSGLLVVRDYDGDPSDIWGDTTPPIPITVEQHLTMAPGGTLRMVFEADAWDSTFSFAPGIPVALGGTLELTFADDVIAATQRGRTFDLFDWTGVAPTGTFAVSSPYHWDVSHLYTTGQVTLTAIPEPASALLLLIFGAAVGSRRAGRISSRVPSIR